MMETGFTDTFTENDLKEPDLLPEDVEYIGQIVRVNTENAKPGNFRKFPEGMKSDPTRTEVPIITISVMAKTTTDGTKVSGETFNRFVDKDFWIGDADIRGRHQLRDLISKLLSLNKSDLYGQSMVTLAEKLVGGWLKFSVKHRTYTDKYGDTRKVQAIAKYKIATAEDIGKAM